MALKPETATRLCNGEREEVTTNSLRPGDVIEVVTGGRLPTDGRLLSLFASFDESVLTGGSIPVERAAGDKAPVGATNVDRLVTPEMLSEPSASTINRILKLIGEAKEHHAPIERFVDHFSHIYTPVTMAVALLVTLAPPLPFTVSWQGWIYKGLTLLLVGYPYALVIFMPTATTPGLTAAAHHEALTKGGTALEQLDRVIRVVFDETGTLTVGEPRVTAIHPTMGINESELLTLAAVAEQDATRLLTQAIICEAQVAELVIPTVESQRVLVGFGIETQINGERVLICVTGKHPTDAFTGLINELEGAGQAVVLVVRSDDVLGIIALWDTLRAGAAATISELNALGVKGVILTGDNPRTAMAIARELGLEFKVGLLPEDRVKVVAKLNQHVPLAMVDDGINDASVTKAATIGITVDSSADVTLGAADTILTYNHLRGLVQMIEPARATHANIRQNITITLGLKGIFFVTTLLGIAELWLTVSVDTGATMLVTASMLGLLCRRQGKPTAILGAIGPLAPLGRGLG